MASSWEARAVEWSRNWASFGRMDDPLVSLFGDGARMIPLAFASAGVWLLLQKLTVPVCMVLAPSFVRSVKEVAIAKSIAKKRAKSSTRAATAALNDLGVRGVAFVFSCVASYGAVKLTFADPPPSFEQDMFFAATPESTFYCAVAAGYFLWDLPMCLAYGYGFGFLLHAVSALLAEIIALHPLLQPVMSWAHLFELSTPFLNARLLMIACGRTKSLFFRLCEATFFFTFFAVRIVYGYFKSWGFITYTARDLLSDSSLIRNAGGTRLVVMAWTAITISTTLCVLNAFWGFGIVKLGLGIGSKAKVKVAPTKRKD